jgi:hypothetical protein
MRTTILAAFLGLAVIAALAAVLGTAPDTATGAAPAELTFEGSGSIPVSVPPLW